MMIKRIFGYLLILVSIFLALTVILQLQTILKEIIQGLAQIGGEGSEDSIRAITKAVLWVIYIWGTYLAWSYGRKLSKSRKAA